MKRWVCILIILFNFGVCRAQWEHLFLSRFNPKIIYTRDREEDKPAGYELSIPWMYNGVYAINDNKSFWTFLTSKRHGTIGIQTPLLTYNGTTTILRIIDTTKTVYNIVSFDTIRNRIPETIISNQVKNKVSSFLRRQRNRRNMIIQNDSLTIYLINIKPQNLEKICRVVTTPIADYR